VSTDHRCIVTALPPRASATPTSKADIRELKSGHPSNSRSRMVGTELGRLAGLERTGISLVRIPAGHESFVYHCHHREEEWLYILSGRGVVEIDDGEYDVESGDFIGFPTPSVAHHLRNPGPDELVYLMGGERRHVEIADFPRLRRRMIRIGDEVSIHDLDSAGTFERPDGA
jgi:uncharacterized cupin superfamily protein